MPLFFGGFHPWAIAAIVFFCFGLELGISTFQLYVFFLIDLDVGAAPNEHAPREKHDESYPSHEMPPT
jgi:hypothetical protein